MYINGYGNYSSLSYSALNSIGTASIIIFVIALIVSIVAFFVFLPESKKDSYHGFVKYLYNFFNKNEEGE